MTTPDPKALAARLREAFGQDSGHTVAAKLSLAGTPISAQAVYKWLRGGEISDDNLAAVCHIYHVAPAWLKFGQEPKRPMTDGDRALVDLITDLPDETRQMALDFIGYQLTHNPPLVAGESISRYMRYIDRVKTDLAQRRKRAKQ